MSQPSDFTNTTPRHALPYLFPGQAQREFYVNESLARLDLLLHPVVEGMASDPPSDPAEGHCYLVAAPASGEWSGRENQIAGWVGGAWVFAEPREGMIVRDASASASLYHAGGSWSPASAPQLPNGGAVIDVEARSTIDALITLLRQIGIFA